MPSRRGDARRPGRSHCSNVDFWRGSGDLDPEAVSNFYCGEVVGERLTIDAAGDEDLAEARALFKEYADSIAFSLSFQGFDRELAELPGRYAPPSGRLLLARVDSLTAGCVALRKIEDGVCEMKRLFVRPAYLGKGIGRRLAEAILREGRAAGYRVMRLDTVPSMGAAMALYESIGFRDIAPYTENPIEGARFMECSLGLI
jgi:putative acetyltransferase